MSKVGNSKALGLFVLLLVAMFAVMAGMLMVGSSTDRGTPSRIVFTGPGCELLRATDAKIDRSLPDGTCVASGYYRPALFSSDALISQGELQIHVGGQQIVGHARDEGFSLPYTSSEVRNAWMGGLLIAASLVTMALALRGLFPKGQSCRNQASTI